MEVAVHVILQWMGFKQEGLCCHSLLQLPKKKRHEAAVSAIKAWAVDVEFIAANILLTGSAAFVVFYHPSGVDKSMTLHLQRWFVEFRPHLLVPTVATGAKAVLRRGHQRRQNGFYHYSGFPSVLSFIYTRAFPFISRYVERSNRYVLRPLPCR